MNEYKMGDMAICDPFYRRFVYLKGVPLRTDDVKGLIKESGLRKKVSDNKISKTKTLDRCIILKMILKPRYNFNNFIHLG